MEKFRNNIFSEALGSIGGMTFSLARVRKGKIQTARQRGVPLNPQSPAQTLARTNMKDSVVIAREVNDFYPFRSFDRTVSKLPGHQSLLSVYQGVKQVSGSNIFVTGVPVNIGKSDMSAPEIINVVNDGGGIYMVDYAIGEGETNPDDIINFGVIANQYPISSLPSLRFQGYRFDVLPVRRLEIDFGGFPGQDTGILVFAMISTNEPISTRQISQITWANSAI